MNEACCWDDKEYDAINKCFDDFESYKKKKNNLTRIKTSLQCTSKTHQVRNATFV